MISNIHDLLENLSRAQFAAVRGLRSSDEAVSIHCKIVDEWLRMRECVAVCRAIGACGISEPVANALEKATRFIVEDAR